MRVFSERLGETPILFVSIFHVSLSRVHAPLLRDWWNNNRDNWLAETIGTPESPSCAAVNHITQSFIARGGEGAAIVAF